MQYYTVLWKGILRIKVHNSVQKNEINIMKKGVNLENRGVNLFFFSVFMFTGYILRMSDVLSENITTILSFY